MTEQFQYIGGELALFAKATNWKRYLARKIHPFISGDVLEVGAGIGETTRILSEFDFRSWLCLEPDGYLAAELKKTISSFPNHKNIKCRQGFLIDLPYEFQYNTILYIDVLEHIEKDILELETASQYLRPDGHIIIVVPAHQWLFTPFDSDIGHFRRYNKVLLTKIFPESLQIRDLFYMDCVGLFASLSNKLLLNQKMPSLGQIMTWDRIMVPMSRWIDLITMHRFGKTLVAIGKKTNA